jgi:hypothetical protein
MAALLTPLFSLEALLMCYLHIHIVIGYYGKTFEGFLSGFLLVLTLVTPCGATPFLEAMSTSPRTHILDGDLHEKI